MKSPDSSGATVGQIRRLRGVSWEWREGAPVEALPPGREAGVIAQEVRPVFPHLVKAGPSGYLTVDYGGLAVKIAEATVELANRIDRLAAGRRAEPELSDANAKRGVGPVESALARLRSGEDLERAHWTALVGALVEAVKELDTRLVALEGRAPPDQG